MNSNWSKILLFSLLFGVLGFILGHVFGASCSEGKCDKGSMSAMRSEACAHDGKEKCCMMKDGMAMHDKSDVSVDSVMVTP